MKTNWHPPFYELPDSVQKILQSARIELNPTSIVLFGSRARGDYRENSDFDIALKGVHDKQNWTEFCVNLEEKPWSLYSIDMVQFESLGKDYKKNIQAEGVQVYG